MSPKERVMTALRNGQPDRVPATPDMSIMIPCRMTGKPFWEIELNGNPSYTTAYVRAARYLGIDGWVFNGALDFQYKTPPEYETKVLASTPDLREVLTVIHTPDGDLRQVTVYPKDNPCTVTEKLIKDFEADFPKLRHLYSEVVSYDATRYRAERAEVGDTGMLSCGVYPPGFQTFFEMMRLEDLAYAHADSPDLFEEWVYLHDRRAVRMAEMAVDAGVDAILTGGSGSLTLQSPDLFRELSFPTIQKITAMTKAAGIISGIHSCGKEYAIVEACANESDLDYINPLEIPPMGDCDLATVKERFGDKLALMGNLHTTEVMLRGTTRDVRRESLKAIRDAGAGGGFVLSTGDQCGRDTPFDNILEMVAVVKEYGVYPLDIDRINDAIAKLEKDAEPGR